MLLSKVLVLVGSSMTMALARTVRDCQSREEPLPCLLRCSLQAVQSQCSRVHTCVYTGDSEQDRKRARLDHTSLRVTIINPGSGREGDELVEFVMQNAVLLLAPSFSTAAFKEFVEISPSAAGYHKKKRRATMQSTTLDKIVGDSVIFPKSEEGQC